MSRPTVLVLPLDSSSRPSLSAFSSLQSILQLESSSRLRATEFRTQSLSLESQAESLEHQATSTGGFSNRAWSAMPYSTMAMDMRTRAANSAFLHNNLLEQAEDCRRLAVVYEQLGDDVGCRIAPFLITTGPSPLPADSSTAPASSSSSSQH